MTDEEYNAMPRKAWDRETPLYSEEHDEYFSVPCLARHGVVSFNILFLFAILADRQAALRDY